VIDHPRYEDILSKIEKALYCDLYISTNCSRFSYSFSISFSEPDRLNKPSTFVDRKVSNL